MKITLVSEAKYSDKKYISQLTIFSSLVIIEDVCEPYSREGGRKKMMIHHKGYNHRSAKSLSKLLKTQYALTHNWIVWIYFV